MLRVLCYIRPHRLEAVKSAVAAIGVNGMTVSDVRGTGNSPETTDWLGGSDGLVALPIRAKLEVVIADEILEDVLTEIQNAAQTGEPGDGKIFVEPVADAIRIRTLERGEEAI